MSGVRPRAWPFRPLRLVRLWSGRPHAGSPRRGREPASLRRRPRWLVRLVLEGLLGAEDLVLQPAPRVRARGRVEEHAESDAPEEQAHVSRGVRVLALGPLARPAELLHGSLQLLLEVLVAGDAHRDAGGPAVAQQLVVDPPRRLVGLLHVVVQLLVACEPLGVRPSGVDRSAHCLLAPHRRPFVGVRGIIYPRAAEENSSTAPRGNAASTTSSTPSARTKRIPSRTSLGRSSRSGSFSRGRMTVSMPARWAASTFSLTPPIGSTWPVSVISPVMATSSETGVSMASDASAVAMAMPAEGPSFGTAPAGTWMWTSRPSNQYDSRPRSRACPRTQESAACADSFMTSPICPVTISLPLPGIAVASTKRTSPPTGVTARPVATPGSDVRLRTSAGKRRRPSHVRTRRSSTRARWRFDSAISRAALRHSAAICRSSSRTPASRVYSRITRRRAFSVKVSCAFSRP